MSGAPTSLVMAGTAWGRLWPSKDTTPPSSLVFQPKNQVAGTCIPQESRDITTTQRHWHPTSAPFSSCGPGAN